MVNSEDCSPELKPRRRLRFRFGLRTKEGVDGFQSLKPGCVVTHSIVNNGMAQLARAQREALQITPDLTLFPRAQRGDPDAIKALLATVDEGDVTVEDPRWANQGTAGTLSAFLAQSAETHVARSPHAPAREGGCR